MLSPKLEGVHTSLGCIVRSSTEVVGSVSFTVVAAVIKPSLDLLIDEDVQIDLLSSPSLADKGGVIVRLADSSQKRYFLSEHIASQPTSDKVELSMPWLASHTYPLSVWFFSVRLLLKKPNLDAWRASVLMQDFWHVPTGMPPSSWMQPTLEFIPGSDRNMGRRKYMEDVEVLFENIRASNSLVNVYGVLDGHGGDDCSQHCAEDIPMKIAGNLRKGKTSSEALFCSFRDTDEEYLRNSSGVSAGSTANIALFDRTRSVVYVANTGDTRAVLCRNFKAVDLSLDRKASDPEEIARIASAGGFVVNNRVSGSLAITRALGDGHLKARQKNVLIPDPEITFFVPCRQDQFVVIATDGLWDVVSSQQAADFVRQHLETNGLSFPEAGNGDVSSLQTSEVQRKLKNAAKDLISHALGLGSADNITVVVLLIVGATLDASSLSEYTAASVASFTAAGAGTCALPSENARSLHC